MKQVKDIVSKALSRHQIRQKATPSAPQACNSAICNYADNYYGDQVCVLVTAEVKAFRP